MDFTEKLALSYYKTIATINDPHNIYLVQHQENQKIYVKKTLDVYNPHIYERLLDNHIPGTPQIVQTFEEDNQLTVIEEYISGISLQEKIQKSDLAEEDILNYMIDLCNILQELHSFTPAIIHRDIKPSNVIITNYNRAVLLDFNAAKFFTESSEDTVLLGTQGYAAPEQYGFGASSPQTDIYSLGIIFKEMLASVNSSSAVFESICKKCTMMKPNERYRDIAALKKDLERQLDPVTKNSAHTDVWFLPPGYRTKKIWKMVIATPVYVIITWLCMTLEVQDVTGSKLWFERFTLYSMMLFVIFSSFNYLDIQKINPLRRYENRIIRYIGVIILDIVYFILAMTFLSFVETFF